MLKIILSWLTGGGIAAVGRELRQARLDALNAQNAEQRIIADVHVKELEAEMEQRWQAAEIRRETAGFWEMRALTFLIAAPFALHAGAVGLDTTFRFGWGVPAYPPPFDEWEGRILLSFFGVQVVSGGIMAIAGAIRRRG